MSLYCRKCGGTSYYYMSGECSDCGQPMYQQETGEMVPSQQKLFPHLPKQDPDFVYKKVYGPEVSADNDVPACDLGNAMKYICLADLKGKAIEDLKKAVWYIEREIKRREGMQK